MKKDLLEKIVESPAKVLDKTISGTGGVAKGIVNQKPIQRVKKYWEALGPGLTTGASDDDPSGIATYSQTGATYGYKFLWLAPLTFPLMAVVQEMCARIGLVTGRGLAANIRIHFPRWVLYTCAISLFVANSFNLGADLGAMAQAGRLLFPSVSFNVFLVGFTLLCLFLQIFSTYNKYAKILKWLALVLLSYVISAFLIKDLDWGEVFRSTIRPSISFTKDQIFLVCAILGTTISPYLFFWQTSQEVENDISIGRTNLKLRQAEMSDREIKEMRIDVWSGILLSNIVMFFIFITCASTLHQAGITNIQTAADAAVALRPLAGDATYLLFAVGVIGTGLLGVPVLAGSASYAISESFGWRGGLNKKLSQAYSFYGVIIISMIVGLAINFTKIDSIKALIYSAVINGLVAPIVLVLIVLLASNKKVMGDRVNSFLSTGIGWISTFLMVITGIATIVMWLIN